jgi:hypothetical protein
MLLLSLLSVGILIRAAWSERRQTARARATGLLAALGGSLTLAAGLGWGRAGFGYQHKFTYPTLVALIPCLLYLAWGFDRSARRGHCVQAILCFGLSLVASLNIPQWWAQGKANDAACSAFERDLRGGAPEYLLMARHWHAMGRLSYPFKPGTPSEMQMLRSARVGSFSHLQDETPMRTVSIPLTATQFGRAECNHGVVVATRATSFLTFTLPKTMYAAAIRVQCGEPSSKGPFVFGISWKGTKDPEVPKCHYIFSGFPVTPVMFAVADTVEKLRIYPNMIASYGSHPFQFPLTKLEVLVPEGEPQTSAARKGPIEPARQ